MLKPTKLELKHLPSLKISLLFFPQTTKLEKKLFMLKKMMQNLWQLWQQTPPDRNRGYNGFRGGCVSKGVELKGGVFVGGFSLKVLLHLHFHSMFLVCVVFKMKGSVSFLLCSTWGNNKGNKVDRFELLSFKVV